MTYTPRTTEYAARETADGLLDEILGLINPTNDNTLAPWMMARSKAQELVVVLDTACNAIAARPMVTGNDAMRAIADEPPFSEEPFHEQIRQTIEARRIPVETPQEAEVLDEIEARQVDLAKPEVFDIQGFVQSFFNMPKGA